MPPDAQLRSSILQMLPSLRAERGTSASPGSAALPLQPSEPPSVQPLSRGPMAADGKLHLVVLDGGAAEAPSRDIVRSRRARAVRAKTIAARFVRKRDLERDRVQADYDEQLVGPIERPRTRADCVDGPRPCPWVGCRHHLYLDIGNVRRDSIKYNWPDLEPDHLPESCSLDVADRGGCNLELLGDHMNVTRERARQMEERLLTSPRVREALRNMAPSGDLQRPAVRATGGQGRPKAAAPKVEPAEDDPADHGYRTTTIGLTDAEHLECARFGSIAGAYVLAGVRPALAWQRANEWLEEFPGEMPEGISLVVPERKKPGSGLSLVTPVERRSEPPRSVEHLVPRSDASGVDDGDGELPMVGSEALLPPREEGPQLLAPSRRPENRRKATAPATAIAARVEPATKEETMSIKQQVFDLLRKAGDGMKSGEIIKAVGADPGTVTVALSALKKSGHVAKTEGYGGDWSVVPGATFDGAAPAKPAKKTGKAKAGRAGGKARTAKANGHANGAASSDPISAALATLKERLLAKTQRTMKAIDAIDALDELLK